MAATLNPNVGRDFHNAKFLATACELAYLPADQGEVEFKSKLDLNAELISCDNTQVYVGENGSSIVAAFRGSESPTSIDGFKDWLLTNAKNFLIVPEGRMGTDFSAAGVGAKFHQGFIEALAEIWTPLLTAIKTAVGANRRPVWVTGHSLGGALAQLAAWRLHRNFIPVHQLYTFGAPMIGNDLAAEAFQRTFPNKIFRFVDTRDLVPKLPTVSLQSNEYKHSLEEVVLGPRSVADAFTEAAGKTVDGVLNSTIIDEVWGQVSTGVDSHLLTNYLARITEQLDG